MEKIKIADVARAWREYYNFDQLFPELVDLGLHTMRLLAEGRRRTIRWHPARGSRYMQPT